MERRSKLGCRLVNFGIVSEDCRRNARRRRMARHGRQAPDRRPRCRQTSVRSAISRASHDRSWPGATRYARPSSRPFVGVPVATGTPEANTWRQAWVAVAGLPHSAALIMAHLLKPRVQFTRTIACSVDFASQQIKIPIRTCLVYQIPSGTLGTEKTDPLPLSLDKFHLECRIVDVLVTRPRHRLQNLLVRAVQFVVRLLKFVLAPLQQALWRHAIRCATLRLRCGEPRKCQRRGDAERCATRAGRRCADMHSCFHSCFSRSCGDWSHSGVDYSRQRRLKHISLICFQQARPTLERPIVNELHGHVD